MHRLMLSNLNIKFICKVGRLQHLTTDGVQLHQKEIRLAQISVGIVAVFILCHAVKWVPNIWELLQVGDHEVRSMRQEFGILPALFVGRAVVLASLAVLCHLYQPPAHHL